MKILLNGFFLKAEAQVWWEFMGRVHACDGMPISYKVFRTKFEKKYIPNVVRDKKAAEFVQLV